MAARDFLVEVSNIQGGSIGAIGTMPAITIGNSTGGTLDIVTRIGNIGTIESGTITSTMALNTGTITTIAAGTQNTLGTVGTVPGVGVVTTITNLSNGTIQNSGTTTGVGVVTSVTNLVSGTLLSSGTTTGVGVVTSLSGGTITKLEGGTLGILSQGSINVTAGTITAGTLTNLVSGTINSATVVLNSGTINVGTVVNNGGSVSVSYPSFNWRASAGTTTLKSSAGILHGLFGTYTGAGTLYNSAGTSASIIWGGIITLYPLTNFDVGFGSLTWAGSGASSLTVVYS